MTGTGLLLHGGTVFDGLGAPGRVADVAVVDGRVVAVGDDRPAGLRRIGGDGLAVAPLDPGSAEVAATLWSSLAGGVPIEPASFGQLTGRLDRAAPVDNLAPLVGHGTLRLTANGLEERLLGRDVRELGVLTWEQAVRKTTWLGPASSASTGAASWSRGRWPTFACSTRPPSATTAPTSTPTSP
jgi:hypothetical protein